MKNKCTQCEKELTSTYDFGLCYDCEKKQKAFEMKVMMGLCFGILILLAGVRILWAKLVYHDYRCAFGECRIIKGE